MVGTEIGGGGRPTRILLVDHADFLGGAEHSVLELLRSINPNRYQMVLACAPGSLMDAARKMGAAVVPLELQQLRGARNVLRAPFRFSSGARKLAGIIRRERVEIVHSNTMRSDLYASVAARVAGAKFLWHVRDLHRSRAFVWTMALAAHAIIANSRAVALTIPGFAGPKTGVVYNGVSLDDFERGRTTAAFRAELGVSDSEWLIGTVGWLAPWKGQRAFIETAFQMATRCPRARFVIAGGVSDSRYKMYEHELRAQAERLLGDRLIFAGERSPIQPVLAALDLMLHCADHEPFGRVLIEAMAMQVPVIAFNGGGPDEIIEDGVSGYLVTRADTGSMATAALSLLDNPDMGRAMGKAGRERARALFDSAANARLVEHVYDSLGPAR